MKRPLAVRLGRAAYALAPHRLQWAMRELAPAAFGPQHRLSYSPAYRGAAVNRMNSDWQPGAMSASTELRESLQLLRQRGRDLRRNNPYAKQFLRLAATNVVGPYGFTSRPQVRLADGKLDRETNKALSAWWAGVARTKITLDRRLALAAAEAHALETFLTDGECFVRMLPGARNPLGLALQFIDADLIDDRGDRPASRTENEIRNGIELDAEGAPVGYWVNNPLVEYGWPNGDRYFVPAWNPHTGQGEMLHLYMPMRVNQGRGVTIFHAAMELLNQLYAYNEAEVYAARNGATTLGFIVPPADAEGPTDLDDLGTEATEAAGVDGEPAGGPRRGATRPEEIINEPLAWHRLHGGESVQQFKVDHPNAILPEFNTAMLQGIASGCGGLHYEIANDLSGVNYTASRAGQITQQDVWRMLQEIVIQDLRAPVYYTALRLALLRGQVALPGGRRARAVGELGAVDHRGRGWVTMNTLQDTQNHALRIACGLRSRHQVMAEDNEDFDETLEQLAEENAEAERLRVAIAPPGSLAADVAASIAEEEQRRADEEKRPARKKDEMGSPAGAHPNGNGTEPAASGLALLPSAPTRTPRPGGSRF